MENYKNFNIYAIAFKAALFIRQFSLLTEVSYDLISLNNTDIEKPAFWVRDKAQVSAEIDLILNYQDK